MKKEIDWISQMCVFSFVMTAVSVCIAMIGFHNMDSGQNMRYLNSEYDLSLVDFMGKEYYTPEKAYHTGVKLLFIGVYGILSFSLLFGITLNQMSQDKPPPTKKVKLIMSKEALNKK